MLFLLADILTRTRSLDACFKNDVAHPIFYLIENASRGMCVGLFNLFTSCGSVNCKITVSEKQTDLYAFLFL